MSRAIKSFVEKSSVEDSENLNLVAIAEKKNIANILKRQLDGKPISKAQMDILRASQQSQPILRAKNIVSLAAALGCTRRTVSTVLKRFKGRHPGSNPDGTYDVNAWRSFFDRHGICPEESDEIGKAKLELLHAQIRRIVQAADREAGALIAKDDVVEKVRGACILVQRELMLIPSTVASGFGSLGPEIQEVVKREIERALETLREKLTLESS